MEDKNTFKYRVSLKFHGVAKHVIYTIESKEALDLCPNMILTGNNAATCTIRFIK